MRFAAVVLAHHLLDGLARLISMVEWDGAHIMVQNMGFDDAVEKVTANPAKVAVDGGSCTTSEVPDLGFIVRESRVGVLQVGDGDCKPIRRNP